MKACIRCGLEQHHVFGKGNDPNTTISVCQKCHTAYTDMQRSHYVDLSNARERNVLEWAADILIQLGEFCNSIANMLIMIGEAIRHLTVALDTNYASWRRLPEATHAIETRQA